MEKKKVLIIDDSLMVRKSLTEIINGIEGFTVIGAAEDPKVGAELVLKLKPDIITLDIEMPIMDGLTFLEKLMRLRPMPVLMISSYTDTNSAPALAALELGAVDYIKKPTIGVVNNLDQIREEIKEKLLICAHAKVHANPSLRKSVDDKYKAQGGKVRAVTSCSEKVIAIGASTGGTVALLELLKMLPADMPGIVLVQHMPAGFTKTFAERLDNDCAFHVKEAADGDEILKGLALLAPGGQQMDVVEKNGKYFVHVYNGAPVNRHAPSVDVLFNSVAKTFGKNAVGVILTGMGGDGAEGLLRMKEAGAFTYAQSEESCTVFGMPKVAIEKNAHCAIGDLKMIADSLKGKR